MRTVSNCCFSVGLVIRHFFFCTMTASKKHQGSMEGLLKGKACWSPLLAYKLLNSDNTTSKIAYEAGIVHSQASWPGVLGKT